MSRGFPVRADGWLVIGITNAIAELKISVIFASVSTCYMPEVEIHKRVFSLLVHIERRERKD